MNDKLLLSWRRATAPLAQAPEISVMVRPLLALSLLALAGCVSAPTPDPRWTSSVVDFSARERSGKLVLKCEPLRNATGIAWVDECERMGRVALDDAAARGTIRSVAGGAFGQAADLFRRMPQSEPMAGKALEREVPLVGTAL